MNWHVRKFHLIAPIYQFFFRFQTFYYWRILRVHLRSLKLEKNSRILDLGSGTGAFAYSWQKAGYPVLAADAAPGMIRQCKKNGLDCMEFDILKGIPFVDKSFSVVTAAYLAHGLSSVDREIMYRETSRVAEKCVIFHDFSNRYNFFISFIESLEGSYYREFISSAPAEMEKHFDHVEVISVDPWHNWYICRP